ncbi:MAG: hypothetical protein ACON4T_05380 [Synechococcus sp.]
MQQPESHVSPPSLNTKDANAWSTDRGTFRCKHKKTPKKSGAWRAELTQKTRGNRGFDGNANSRNGPLRKKTQPKRGLPEPPQLIERHGHANSRIGLADRSRLDDLQVSASNHIEAIQHLNQTTIFFKSIKKVAEIEAKF